MDPVEVARHFEQSLANVAVAIAPHSERIGSAVASYGEPGSWLNQCWNFGMDGGFSSGDVDRIIAFYDARQCEAKVGIATVADPSAIEVLAGHGFELHDSINMLVADLTADIVTPGPRHEIPPGLEIQQVDKTNDDSVDRWAELSTRGFNEGDPAPSAVVRTAAAVLRYYGVGAYIATIHGEPAAAAALGVNDAHGLRSGGLFATSVLPQFRGLGIQQHLIATRLNRARELYCTIATIGSTPGKPTERNAARYGFQLSYVKAILARPSSTDQI